MKRRRRITKILNTKYCPLIKDKCMGVECAIWKHIRDVEIGTRETVFKDGNRSYVKNIPVYEPYGSCGLIIKGDKVYGY